MPATTIRLDEVRQSRVTCVSDDGLVVLTLPDGGQRIVTIPREAVSLVRRLAALDRERDRDREEVPEKTGESGSN